MEHLYALKEVFYLIFFPFSCFFILFYFVEINFVIVFYFEEQPLELVDFKSMRFQYK